MAIKQFFCSLFFFRTKLRDNQSRLQGLLQESLVLLCKNSGLLKTAHIINAFIVITTTNKETFLVKFKETTSDIVADDNVVNDDAPSEALREQLKERIVKLCKNGRIIKNGFSINALIGFTQCENRKTFFVKFTETVDEVDENVNHDTIAAEPKQVRFV